MTRALFFVALLSVSAVHGQILLETPPPAPGKMVDIGGRKLHLHCTGSGTPAVIVENGASGFSIDW
ncbi:MAG TPA: alpha/beta hydrolase, partial [Thermoanaerobaculia bacterium]|nr:alpha/beta hydrolase [Thermoanaerobaculia bacterium]